MSDDYGNCVSLIIIEWNRISESLDLDVCNANSHSPHLSSDRIARADRVRDAVEVRVVKLSASLAQAFAFVFFLIGRF